MKELMSRPAGIGTVLQSGIPHRRQSQDMRNPRGLLVRGVVVATYATDDSNAPVLASDKAIGIYCDVLVYSSIPSIRYQLVRAVPVLQDRSGIHTGRIWKPRAASFDVTGAPLDVEKATNPANMDGDHVLVGFLDGASNRPVILGALPHPANDIGNDSKAVGNRLRLKAVDGDPDFFKHHGSYYGIADNGDWLIDTTQANTGALAGDGSEPAPPTDGTGSQLHTLPQDAQYRVALMDMSNPASPQVVTELAITKALLELVIDAGAALKVEGKDADAKLTLGDGLKHIAIYEHLEEWWNLSVKPLMVAFDAHVHPTGVGPSGPPTPIVNPPDLATNAKSTKATIPDG